MRGELRIAKRNWKHFENSLDSLTKEPYKIGDRVVKCNECKLTFHAEYLEDEKCPSCRKPFVPAVIETGVIRLGYDRKIVLRSVKKAPTGQRWWNRVDLSRFAVRWLTWAGALGFVFSVGLLTAAVMTSGIGWDGFASWMSGAVLPEAALRLWQAAGSLMELPDGMQALAGQAADQLTPALGALKQLDAAIDTALTDLIYWLNRL